MHRWDKSVSIDFAPIWYQKLNSTEKVSCTSVEIQCLENKMPYLLPFLNQFKNPKRSNEITWDHLESGWKITQT